jgi:glyoxylase-like metal-dependent hydrolase (beta-lactamase superfamily II)
MFAETIIMHDSNIYLILSKKTALVDCGTGGFGKEAIKDIKDGLKKKKLDIILLTHEHYDHVGGIKGIKEEFGGEIFAHPYTAKALEKGKNLVTGAIMFGKLQKKIKGVKSLEEGEVIDLGDDKLEVLYTPGHSKGSISFYNREENALFPGDVVFTMGGIGRWDLPGGDLKTLKKTIGGFLEFKLKGLYPGHGPYTEKYGHSHIEKALDLIASYGRFM